MANYKKGAKKAGRWIKKEGKWVYQKIYGHRTASQAVKATANTAKDIASLALSIAQIRARLNVEKHHKDVDVNTVSVAQCSQNADGWSVQDVTPVIAQGNNQDQRKGNSLKLTGMSFPISFQGEANCLSARKLRVSLLRVRSADDGVSATEAIEQYFDVNPLNGLRDANCPRNYRNGSHDGITCIRSKTYMLKAPALDVAGTLKESSHFTAKFNVKLNDILRFAQDADSSPNGIRYYLVFQADAGNRHLVNASTLDVPVKDINSHVAVRISQRLWYVDN